MWPMLANLIHPQGKLLCPQSDLDVLTDHSICTFLTGYLEFSPSRHLPAQS